MVILFKGFFSRNFFREAASVLFVRKDNWLLAGQGVSTLDLKDTITGRYY